MATYKVLINTDNFTHFPCSKKNWEPGTINDFMMAINGWKSTERGLQEVRWRIELFFKHAHYHCGNQHWEKWFDRKKNKIKYRDRLCGFDRVDDVSVPGFAQGYVDIEKLMGKLKAERAVRIPFNMGYDMRQRGSKAYKGCYMEIRRVA